MQLRGHLRSVGLLLTALVACGEDAITTAATTGGGGHAGAQPAECEPGSALVADSCVAAGVPPEACPDGFSPEHGGCTPILPDEPCDDGLVALPGETTCRPLADCGAPPWGDIPVDAGAVYVDASYAGGDGDGSADKPFVTLAEAVFAADDGALIAIAAGSYLEDTLYLDKRLRIWGRCPELVEIAAQDSASLMLIDAHASELHTLAITSVGAPIYVNDALDVLFDRIWFHDTGEGALTLSTYEAQTSATVVDSLFERVGGFGIILLSADARIERTILRDLHEGLELGPGRGLDIERDPEKGTPSHAEVVGCVIERARESGMAVLGSELTLTDSVVREILPQADGRYGAGVVVQEGFGPAVAEISGSYIGNTHMFGLTIANADVSVLDTTIEDVLPQAGSADFGDAVVLVQSGGGQEVTIETSRLARAARAGIANFSGSVSLRGVALECNTFPLDSEDLAGPITSADLGGNACWCGADVSACQWFSQMLRPP